MQTRTGRYKPNFLLCINQHKLYVSVMAMGETELNLIFHFFIMNIYLNILKVDLQS